MSEADDIIAFVEEDVAAAEAADASRWKIAIIDDDRAIHDGTRFALYDYELDGRGLEILSAFSAREGRELLKSHPDVAVILLDVVMETEGAGLEIVDFIRNELKNETVRIILRTGHPGQAPERRVILDYDINDYKAKTELTADKLFTTLTASLRSYQQLHRMVETRRGLEIIIEAASTLFDVNSMQRLAEGVLTQLASLINAECAGILVLRDAGQPSETISILAGSGCYRDYAGRPPRRSLDTELHDLVRTSFERRRHEFNSHRSVLYLSTGSGREVVVLIESPRALSKTDRSLVEVFCSRLSIAFDNVLLYEQLQEANQRLEERVAKRTSELTAANRRLSSQWLELRRANRFKGEMLGIVAHDLKNPLGVIMGRTEMLADLVAMPTTPSEQVNAQIGHIRDSARRLIAMVDTLISDALNDAHDIAIRREPIDLATLSADVVEANRPLLERKGQHVTVTGVPHLAILGDQDRLYEAVDNLVSNAIKYSPQGSAIAVDVARDEAHALVRVKDEGPGLSPEDRSRLFGRFQRLSAKPTGGESSTGLGLSIAKRIVELHGGDIVTADNGAGPGSTFTISLPFDQRT